MLPHSQKQYPPWKKIFLRSDPPWQSCVDMSTQPAFIHQKGSLIMWLGLIWALMTVQILSHKKKKKTKIIHSSFYQVQILKSCLYWSSHHHLHHDLHCSLWPDEGHTPSVSPCCSGSVLVSNVSILVIKVCLCHFVILLNSLFLNKMWVFNRHFIRSLQNVHL